MCRALHLAHEVWGQAEALSSGLWKAASPLKTQRYCYPSCYSNIVHYSTKLSRLKTRPLWWETPPHTHTHIFNVFMKPAKQFSMNNRIKSLHMIPLGPDVPCVCGPCCHDAWAQFSLQPRRLAWDKASHGASPLIRPRRCYFHVNTCQKGTFMYYKINARALLSWLPSLYSFDIHLTQASTADYLLKKKKKKKK